ncbi:MAG: cobalt ECF transporter T component CbiQ [Gammaproteobacteria bacterium]|jgi:cobalt ECF transporter T component CbiQ
MSGKGLSLRTDLMIQEYQESAAGGGVHDWDPRVKLALLVGAVAANVVIAKLWLSVLLFCLALMLIGWSSIPARLFMLFFLAPAWATLLVFLGFSVGFGTTEVAQFGFLTIYREGMVLGFSAAARVASDMSWMALVFLTTSFTAILRALRWYRIPEVLVDSLGMAYRYAFLLIDQFYRMSSTARAKGGFGSMLERLRTTGMILSQVVLRAYDRATAIQQAMISRGASAAAAGLSMSDLHSAPPMKIDGGYDFDCLSARSPDGDGAVLEARNLTFSYLKDAKPEIDDLGLTVGKGEIVFLCGSNGSGKSTLLKLFAGILRPEGGEIHLNGMRLDKTLRNQAYNHVGLLFQDPDDQIFCPTVAEDIAFGPRNMGLDASEIDRVVATAAELTEVGHLTGRPIHRLSYGELKRIGLAGLLAMRSPLLLLDEPRAYLDPEAAARFVGLVRRLNRELGYTFIIVTHDIDFAAQLATRVVVIDHGRILADGTPREVLTDQALLARSRLHPPLLTRVFGRLAEEGSRFERIPLTAEEAIEALREDGESGAAGEVSEAGEADEI